MSECATSFFTSTPPRSSRVALELCCSFACRRCSSFVVEFDFGWTSFCYFDKYDFRTFDKSRFV